ncbi:MAG: mechanosensitive ion channel [Pirellulaceae bacterium]|nr:mechanosensitive ion channel [Pirellulaceae bacterium]
MTIADVEARISALDADTSLESDAKEQIKNILQTAIDQLGENNSNLQNLEQYQSALKNGASELSKLDEAKKDLPSLSQAVTDTQKLTGEQNAEESQRMVENGEVSLSVLQGDLTKRSKELTQITGRPLNITQQIPIVEATLKDNLTQLNSSEFSGTLSPTKQAARVVLQAKVQTLQSELQMLKIEQQSQPIREQLLDAQVEVLQKKLEIATAQQKELVKAKKALLKTESESVVAKAEAVLARTDANAGDRKIARELVSLSQELDQLIAEMDGIELTKERMNMRLKQLDEDGNFIKAQLVLGGNGEVISQLLMDLRGRILQLQDHPDLLKRIPQLDQARLANLEITRKRVSQRSYERALADNTAVESKELIELRGSMLARVSREYQTVINELSKIASSKQTYKSSSTEMLAFIQDQLFWIRSYPPISLTTFQELREGLQTLFSPNLWSGTLEAFAETSKRRPWAFFGLIAFILGSLLARPRLKKALEETQQLTRRISTDLFRHSFWALCWTVLLAAPPAAVLLLTFWVLNSESAPSRWHMALIHGLQFGSFMAFVIGFVFELCRPNGLGQGHFGWQENSIRRVRFHIALFGLVYIPASMLCLTSIRSGVYTESLGRISFLIAQISTLFLLWHLLRPANIVLARGNALNQTPAITQSGKVWFPLIASLPCFTIVLAATGFFMTASHLSLQLFASSSIILASIIAYWMTYRWYAVKSRRLALSEAIKRRQARKKQAEENKEETSELVAVNPEDEQELDIASIGDQTRHVLKTVFTLSAVVAISMLWAETLPLFTALNDVVLWGSVTLLSLCKAALVAILLTVAVKNLPGLLELSVLRTKMLDSGTRFAITRLVQYITVGVGSFVLFSIIEVDWTKFGWIAAALSVGLGFGLQEVVANFVCGLILLFERPVRVGDVVTLDATTGTVTRIQMRATTITNWERQELIVPNKNLITGTILNWTLSSSITRIVLPVGVAYGTDTDLARQILLQAAVDHPLIVDEPAPSTSFDQFADSSLLITLRCFIPGLDERIKTISELHSVIAKRYADADIEIAFPQMDVNLRPVESGAPAAEDIYT